MFYKLLNILDKKKPFVTVSAKETKYISTSISNSYEPLAMQLSTLTLLRNFDLLNKLYGKCFLSIDEQQQLITLLEQKLYCSNKVKDEVLMLWKYFSNLSLHRDATKAHRLLKDILMNMELVVHHNDNNILLHLLSMVNKITVMYWKSRGIKTRLIQCAPPLSYSICVRR